MLQDGDLTRVGGREVVSTDVRVIAASNVDLERAVDEGSFRKDLYFRLSVFSDHDSGRFGRVPKIFICSSTIFSKVIKKRRAASSPDISKDAMRALISYDWPGNVRELENAVERSVIVASGRQVELADLPESISKNAFNAFAHSRQERASASAEGKQFGIEIDLPSSMDEIEEKVIRATLEYTDGDKSRAARLLNIARRTLYRKIDDFGIGEP